jgi:hypothetical protein
MDAIEAIVGADTGFVPSVDLAARIERGYRLLRQRNEARAKGDRRRHWGTNDAIDIALARADTTDNLRCINPGEPLGLADAIEQATEAGCIPAVVRGQMGVL